MYKKVALFLVSLVILGNGVQAQKFRPDVSKRGTTAASFLGIGMGARSMAMGSSFVAIADDPTSVYWNPAGLVKVPGTQLVFDHTLWIADISYSFFIFTQSLGDYGTIALSFTNSNIGEMDVNTVDEPDGTGQVFTAKDMAFSFGYGLSLTDKFSIGFNPKIIYQSIWDTRAIAIALDMGVLYDTPFDGWTLGASISNYGTKMKLDGNSTLVLYDPDRDNSGNNDKIPASMSTDYWDLPLNFKVGVSFLALKDDINKLILSAEASHPSDNYESVNVGGEYVYGDFLSLRGGYKSLFLSDSEEGFTLGGGIKQPIGGIDLRFDYAFMDFGRLKNTHKITLGLGL